MKRKRGLVSIVVTNYNRSRYIIPCLQSLLRQTYRNTEIIVVDDGSTDNSVQKIERFLPRLQQGDAAKVRLVKLPKNRGFHHAVNVGLKRCRGEFIAMQDSDDLSHRDRIRRQVTHLRKHPYIQIVGARYEQFKNGRFDNRKPARWLKYSPSAIKSSYEQGKHCISFGTILFRAKLYDEDGGMPGTPRGAEDWALINNYISHGHAAQNLRAVLYYYRRHNGQRSRRFYRR